MQRRHSISDRRMLHFLLFLVFLLRIVKCLASVRNQFYRTRNWCSLQLDLTPTGSRQIMYENLFHTVVFVLSNLRIPMTSWRQKLALCDVALHFCPKMQEDKFSPWEHHQKKKKQNLRKQNSKKYVCTYFSVHCDFIISNKTLNPQ